MIATRNEAQILVGMADMKVGAAPAARLVTYALGSCLGIAIHDPVAQVAGLLHVMLPMSTIDPAKAADNPYMFVDTGVPALFKACYQAGAKKERIVVKVAGGSFQGESEDADRFQIGKRNMLTLRKLLWKNGVILHAHDVGGRQTSRTMYLDVASGDVTLRINGQESRL
jgi:chemotaxis protein CheD